MRKFIISDRIARKLKGLDNDPTQPAKQEQSAAAPVEKAAAEKAAKETAKEVE